MRAPARRGNLHKINHVEHKLRGSRKALCTLATGPHVDLLKFSEPGFRRFADRHGYDPIVERATRVPDRPTAWSKIAMLREMLTRYEWCLWIDADALIVRFDRDILEETDRSHSMYLVEHRSGRHRLPNTGVWLLRSDPVVFRVLEAVWSQVEYLDHPYWENAALMHVLGYRVQPAKKRRGPIWAFRGAVRRTTGIDIDARPSRQVEDSSFAEATKHLPTYWNGLIKHDPNGDHRIRHYAGIPLDERLKLMAEDGLGAGDL